MFKQLRPAATLLALLTVLTGVIYPLIVTGLAQVFFPHEANGSLLLQDEKAVGSELIGQAFSSPRHFWGRPSATSPVPYNGTSSAGSNLGPTNPTFLQTVAERVAALRAAHPEQSGAVPADLVTASASGLDPHISPAGAEYQVPRVAKALGMSPDDVRKLVAAHTEYRTLGVLGEPRVNVLKLNLTLDQEAAK